MKTSAEQKKPNYFLSQPHQPFFTLGIFNAIVLMLIFALSYKGVFTLTTGSAAFHVYSLIFIAFSNLFTGFLFTTFPRFNRSEVISKKFYTNVFYSTLLGSTLFLAGSFISHALMLGGMTVLFLSQVFAVLKLQEIFTRGAASDKKDSFWILTALYFGLLGHILFISLELNSYLALPLDLQSLAINISFYLYLIFLTFSVAQRMVPFFSHSFAVKNENFVKIVFLLFGLKTIFSTLDFRVAEIILDTVLGLYLLAEFLRWKLPLLSSPPILWVLHLGLFWLPAAFLLSAISLSAELFLETSFYFLNLHLLAIGFLTTILIGFGTRVTLGHSAQPPHADRLAVGIFLFVQVVVILRALYSVNLAYGWGLNFFFDISFTAWLVLFLVWAWRYGKVLVFGSKL